MRPFDLPPLSARALEIERLVYGPAEPSAAIIYPRERRRWKGRRLARKDFREIALNRALAGIKAAETRRRARGAI